MTEGIKERISALIDGELSEFEVRRVLEEIESDPELKEYWSKLHISRDGMKDHSLGFFNNDISKRVAAELGKAVVDNSETKKLFSKSNFYMASSIIVGMVLVATTVMVSTSESTLSPEEAFASEASEKIAQAIASPEALDVLGRSVTGMNATLEGMDTDSKGQIYANYKMPKDGKTFRVSLSLLSSSVPQLRPSNSSKLTYLKTKEGVFLISVSGNISSETKSQILRNANFTPIKLK
tara:strand:- start:1209 stop:1919 length:711 start_codon:yes stop_codon:yes gene_type:complete